MRGRKPKPTAMKQLAGNPGKRPLNQHEAQPPRVIPNCPSHLNAEAKKEWHRIVKDLHAAGLFTKVDRPALAAYCQAYGRWVMAEKKLVTMEDMTDMTPNGMQVQSVYLQIANKAMEQMRRFLVEFGMTPSARSRVSVEKPAEQDEFEKLFGQKVQVTNG